MTLEPYQYFEVYKLLNPNNVFTIISGSKIEVTDDDIINGYMERYFARQMNDRFSAIIEINKSDYAKEKNNTLYIFYNIRWKIRGTPDEVKKVNLNILNIADKEFYGIKYYLSGRLLSFYQK